MKKTPLYSLIVAAGLVGTQPLAAQAQTAAATTSAITMSPEAQIAAAQANYDACDQPSQPIGPNHRTTVGTAKTGPRQIVEIGTGMNYWNGLQWVPSNPTFVPVANGFLAGQLQDPVQLAGDLYTTNAVTVRTPEGIILGSSPVAVALYDAASGNFAVIATITNCAATLVESNQVLYPDAFSGNVCASVVYTISQGTFHQDVVFTGPLDPANYGFPRDTTRIQIITEFYGAPTPDELTRPLYVEADAKVRAKMASPDLIDHQLGFGRFVMTTGRAYVATSVVNPNGLETPVAKEYKTVGDGTYLFESIPYTSIAAALSNLPPCHPSFGSTKIKSTKGYANIPRPGNKPHPGPLMARASHAPVHGVVVDYVANIGGTMSGVTIFQGDATFLVSSAVSCNGPTTIEGGAVFKYKTGTSITLNSTLTCKTGQYRPAIFTAVDDDAVGDTMNGVSNSGYTGTINSSGYANPALYAASSAINFTGFVIRYAQEGIKMFCGTSYTMSHSQLVNCIKGIEIQNNSCGCGCGCGCGSASYVNVNNCLFSRVTKPILGTTQGGCSVNLYVNLLNVTVDQASALGTRSTSCGLNLYIQSTNSIYASVSSNGTVTAASGAKNAFYRDGNTFGSSQIQIPVNSPPFQTAAGGGYYLAGDTLRGQGTTAGVSSSLLASLKTRTTHPPNVYIGQNIYSPSGEVDFPPYASRDSEIYGPDLGYHYDPLDYVFSNCTVNAAMAFSPGTAVGWQGQALTCSDGESVTFNGTDALPCYFVHCTTVQESAPRGDGTGIAGSSQSSYYLTAYFTRFSASGNVATNFNAQTYNASLNNCEIWSGLVGGDVGGGLNLTCNNCLFDRTTVEEGGPSGGYLYLQNCTLHGGRLNVNNVNNNQSAQAYDSAFDGTVITINNPNGSFSGSHNAYLSNATKLPNDNGDGGPPDQTSFNWQSGLLGYFYLPANSPLIDHGDNYQGLGISGNGAFTTQTTGMPDYNTVDIGYHYYDDIFYQMCPNTVNSPQYWDFCLDNYQSTPDQYGRALTYTVLTKPAHGTWASANNGCSAEFIYTPNSGYIGLDSFVYQISDGVLASGPLVAAITVADPVTANPSPVQTCRDTTSSQFTLGGHDNGCGETLTYSVLLNPTHGFLTLIGSPTDPVYTYTPNNPSGYTGTDSFQYKVANEFGDSDIGTVNITVGDANLCPNWQTAMTGVSQAINLTLTAQDNGPDQCEDNPLTYAITIQPKTDAGADAGTVTPASGNGAVQYAPPSSGFEGACTFYFTVSDGTWTAQCSDAQVTVFVVNGPTLTTSCRSDRIVLNWSLDSVVQQMENQNTDGFYIQDFKIYRATSPGGTYTLIDTVASDAHFYVDRSITANQNYCYLISMEYQDPNTGTIYPTSSPTPGIALYSNESCISTCSVPSNGPTDVAFILDNTGSIWDHTDDYTMETYQNAIIAALTDIETSSGGDYRFALVTPDTDNDNNPITGASDSSGHDMVVVRIPFTNNVAAFEAALNDSNLAGDGNKTPESTDQCLNTVVSNLVANGRQDMDNCAAPGKVLQIGDFTPAFRSNARKLVVLITDAGPGGFCDVSGSYTTTDAQQYAVNAKAQCIKINAIQLSDDPTAQTVMKDYSATSCGWNEQLPYFSTSNDIEDAILEMIYSSGACDCQ
jgi:hypothetical protein